MSTLVGTAIYPEFAEQVRSLVEQHRKAKKGMLDLAVYFAPQRRFKNDVCIFEVVEGFGGLPSEHDQALFEFSYGSTPGFPIPEGSNLRLMLTNPEEFERSISEGWKEARELSAAKESDQTQVIFADAIGKRLWAKLK